MDTFSLLYGLSSSGCTLALAKTHKKENVVLHWNPQVKKATWIKYMHHQMHELGV